MDPPISTQTSLRYPETNHASSSPTLEQINKNGSSSPKLEQINDNAPRKTSVGVSSDVNETDPQNHQAQQDNELSGRERLKMHRENVAGRTSVPEKWSQESLLKEWMDCSSFDKLLAPSGLESARQALIVEGRRAKSQRLRVGSSY